MNLLNLQVKVKTHNTDDKLPCYAMFISMRVVSMVPSWTETLIECGITVVGRTRFCIHPQDQVKSIPAVGGTKDWKWEEILKLKPDLLILDKEENPQFMGRQNEIPFLATHIQSVHDMHQALKEMSHRLNNEKLLTLSQEWHHLLQQPPLPYTLNIPGLIQWGKKPEHEIHKIIYIIWKNPWMAVSANTFVGSMLEFCGMKNLIQTYSVKYPEVDLAQETDQSKTLLLFSSEPYPFLKKPQDLAELGFPYAFVDGECFSWFGVRSLRFLQSLFKKI